MAVMEFRGPSWWSKRAIAKIGYLGVAFCSVDAPELQPKLNGICCSQKLIISRNCAIGIRRICQEGSSFQTN